MSVRMGHGAKCLWEHTVAKKFQEDAEVLTQNLRVTQSALQAQRQALLISNERSTELRKLLDEQHVANSETLAKMSQLLTKATTRTCSCETEK
ncbi:MAG: hypothetical protein ACOYNZ_17380 [Rhodoferax sp.]